MSNNNAVGSRVLLRIFLTVLITVSGLASCGGGGGSTTTNNTTPPTTLSTFNITASAGSGGTITPSGATAVTQGSSQSYTITTNLGYTIATLLVDGVSVSPSTTRTFTSVQADHTISVTFNAVPTYNITASAGSGGTVTPSGATTLTQGSSQSYTITPSLGYIIATVLVDGNTVSASNAYTFTNVQANHTINATFSVATTYTITASAGSNGTVTPSGATSVTQGTSQSYTITPNPGYIVATLMVDGTSVATSTTRTFTNVQANHTISATFSAAPAGNIALSLVPARTSGVAPLAVHFDATATTDTGVTTNPFHDLEYTWNFGDPNSGTWAYGAQPGVSSKNSATGAVAGHLFESPGTYTVTLTAFDGTNSVTRNTIITVQDPNTVFAGTNTICVTNGNTFTGCPSGAVLVGNATDFPSMIATYATTGKRLLFKRGDTFVSSTLANIVNPGPMIVGAFGSGAKPQINMTNNTQILSFGHGNQTISDVRVMDLSLDGNNTAASYGIALDSYNNGAGIVQLLLLRNNFTNFYTATGIAAELPNYYNNQNGWTNTIDQIAFVENTSLGGSNTDYAGYNAGNRFMVLGNHFDNGGSLTGSHVSRWTFLKKAVLSNNDFLRPGNDRHCVYILGSNFVAGVPDPTDANGTTYSAALNGDGISEYIVISDNHFNDNGPAGIHWQVILTPVAGKDARIRNVILERNLHEGTDYSYAAQVFRASYVTSRNNLFVSNANNNYFTFVFIPSPELNPPTNHVWIYNNTMYRSTPGSGGGLTFLYLQQTAISDVTLKNNLVYAPNSTGSTMYTDPGISNFTHTNNSTNAQINGTNPNFLNASGTMLLPTDYKPNCTGTTYPCALGASLPVWSDFSRASQPATRDLGAVVH